MPNPSVPQYVYTDWNGGTFDPSSGGLPLVPSTGVLVTDQTILDALIAAAVATEHLNFSTTPPPGYKPGGGSSSPLATQAYVVSQLGTIAAAVAAVDAGEVA